MILIYHFCSCANRPMIFFLFLMSSWFALSSQITIRNTNGEMLSPLLTSSNWKRRYSTNNSTSIQRIHQLYIIKSIWAENNFIILLILAFHLIILKPQCWWARLGMQCTIIETLWINCIFITGSLIWLLSEHEHEIIRTFKTCNRIIGHTENFVPRTACLAAKMIAKWKY